MTTPVRTPKEDHRKTDAGKGDKRTSTSVVRQALVESVNHDSVAADCLGAEDRREKGKRRGMIDPTTCERPYTHDDIEFMNAMDHYKCDNCRQFPTWSEVLEVLRALGYRRVAEQTPKAWVADQLKAAVARIGLAGAEKSKRAGKILMKRAGERRSGPMEKHA